MNRSDLMDQLGVSVNKGVLCYALERLGLDAGPLARTPHDQQIVLINREEIIVGSQKSHGQEATS